MLFFPQVACEQIYLSNVLPIANTYFYKKLILIDCVTNVYLPLMCRSYYTPLFQNCRNASYTCEGESLYGYAKPDTNRIVSTDFVTR